jgi:hypothetical protein
MELPTTRIDLRSGYAIVFTDVLRKTARLHEAELRRAMTPADSKGVKLSSLQAGIELVNPDYVVDFSKIDAEAVNRIYILNQVKEWSLGPVTPEVYDTLLLDADYKTLVKEMDRLYKASPLVG